MKITHKSTNLLTKILFGTAKEKEFDKWMLHKYPGER